MNALTILDFFLRGLEVSAPIAFAALGGFYSERGGVVNIALEGIMLITAFALVWGSITFGNFWLGLLVAVVAGMLIALVHAVVSIRYKVNQVISGTAINILALGITRFLCQKAYGQETQSHLNPFLPPQVFGVNLIALLLIPIVAVSWFVIYRTVFGLRLRAVGEKPEAADTLGVNVYRMRYSGVLLSGVLCGLAAATLYPSQWVSGMTGGRGFIALAALVFGRWHPIGAVLAALLFGYADNFRIMFESYIPIPGQFVQMFPYVLAVVVLAGIAGKARMPAADGEPYEKSSD